jgi:hypothetical protein
MQKHHAATIYKLITEMLYQEFPAYLGKDGELAGDT